MPVLLCPLFIGDFPYHYYVENNTIWLLVFLQQVWLVSLFVH